MKMNYEQIQAVGLKKGMRVNFKRSEHERAQEATVKKITSKTAWSGAKVQRNAAGKKQYYEISFTNVAGLDFDIVEDTFHSIEVITC